VTIAEPDDHARAEEKNRSRWARIGDVLRAPLVAIVVLLFGGTLIGPYLRKFGDYLNALAKYRDGVLLVVGISYVLGYVVWSVHAWQENLGLVPALRFQYILAGIVPLVGYGLYVAVLVGLLAVTGWLMTRTPGTLLAVATLVVLLGILVAVGAFAIRPITGLWGTLVYAASSVVVLVTGMAFSGVGVLPITSRWIALNLAISFIALYALVLYPNIPQALGGVRPDCAYLEVSAGVIGRQTLETLGAPATGGTIVRTARVLVMASGSGKIFVRPANRRNEPFVVRLNEDDVSTVTSC
jgi:hypothetical protein